MKKMRNRPHPEHSSLAFHLVPLCQIALEEKTPPHKLLPPSAPLSFPAVFSAPPLSLPHQSEKRKAKRKAAFNTSDAGFCMPLRHHIDTQTKGPGAMVLLWFRKPITHPRGFHQLG